MRIPVLNICVNRFSPILRVNKSEFLFIVAVATLLMRTNIYLRCLPSLRTAQVGQASACLLLKLVAPEKIKRRQSEACPTQKL
jgi:hypothetical protein